MRTATVVVRAVAIAILLAAAAANAAEVPWGSRFTINDKLAFDRPLTVTAADIDGDGDIDAISAAQNDDKVSWFSNDDGVGLTWTEIVIDAAFNGPQLVAAGDIDGDGDMDVLGAATFGDEIAWFKNDNGDGSAWTKTSIVTSFDGANSVAAVDIDGDGDMDVVGSAFNQQDVVWWENTVGDGSAWTQHDVDLNFAGPNCAVGFDVDKDGDMDVAALAAGDDEVAWWSNDNGLGTAWTKNTIGVAFDGAMGLHFGDVDGDGDLDAIGAAEFDDEVAWFENLDGIGTSWNERSIATGLNSAYTVYASDLDGDGDIDVAGAARSDNDVLWWENTDGDGLSWTQYLIDGAFLSGRAVWVADVDGDGDEDVLGAAANDDDVAWWENQTIHSSVTYPSQTTIDGAYDGAVWSDLADIDCDGDLDVVGVAFEDDTVSWWANTAGDGSAWTETAIDTVFDGARSVAAADIDGDGDPDVAAAAEFGAEVAWWSNDNGDGSAWTKTSIDAAFPEASTVIIADINGDGDLDVAAGGDQAEDIVWWSNDNGDGSAWTENAVDLNFDGVVSIVAADIDEDGDLDIAAAGRIDDEVAWWSNNNGIGTSWTKIVVNALTIDGVSAVDVADFDRDGDPDVLSGSEASDDIDWHENTAGDGSAWTQFSIETFFNQITSVQAADIDDDGDPDVLSAAFKDDGQIGWWENVAGASSWTQHQVEGPFDPAAGVAGASSARTGDIDSDGALDLVATAATSDRVLWWPHRGGQFALATTNTSPVSLGNSVTDEMLKIVVTHNGLAGEQDIELATLELLFEETPGDPLSTFQADGILENLFVYLDDPGGASPGSFDGGDTLVITVPSFSLTAGVETVAFADGDPNVAISQGTPETFFVVVETTSDFLTQGINSFLITHLTEASSSAEDRDHDIPLTLEFAENVSTNQIDVNPGVEGADLVLTISDSPDPVIAGTALTYTVNVANNGPTTADNVVVTTTLDGDVSLSSTSGCAEDPAGVPTCSLGSLNNGADVDITIVVDVPSGATGTLSTDAAVTSSTPEDNPGDESGTAETAVTQEVDLALTMQANPFTHADGYWLDFRLTITNSGPSDAVASTIDDTFPVILGTIGWTCTATAGSSCNNPTGSGDLVGEGYDVQAGGSVLFRARGNVPPGFTATISNSATVAAAVSEPNLGNNTAALDVIWGDPIFLDDFETGDTSLWSSASPP